MVDLETKTKFGIDKLDIVTGLLPVINATTKKTINYELNLFMGFLKVKIKRDISPQENINLLHGITDYVMSEPQTNERSKAMNYLFNLDFLADPETKDNLESNNC
jgi:hypothetical protein